MVRLLTDFETRTVHSGQASDVAEAIGGITAGDSQSIRSIRVAWACPRIHSVIHSPNRQKKRPILFEP